MQQCAAFQNHTVTNAGETSNSVVCKTETLVLVQCSIKKHHSLVNSLVPPDSIIQGNRRGHRDADAGHERGSLRRP